MRQIQETKELQELTLKILAKFDEFCKEKDIEYFLAYGTLIGAVRHKGYIPWDDDVDLWVKREDYNRIVDQFPEWGEKHGLRLNSPRTVSNYNRIFAKIWLKNTSIKTLDRENDYEEGVYVDLFVIDGSPNNKLLRWLRLTHLQILRNIVTLAAYRVHTLDSASRMQKLYGFLAQPFKHINQNYLCRRYETVAAKSPCNNSEMVQVNYRGTKGRNLLMPSKWFLNSIETKFENISAMIPFDYDSILKELYGDYMQLPPVEKRVSIHESIQSFIND